MEEQVDIDPAIGVRNTLAYIQSYLKKHPQSQVTFNVIVPPIDPPTREYIFVGMEVFILLLGAIIMARMLFKLNDRIKCLEDYRTEIATAEYRGQRAIEIWEQSKEVISKLQGTFTANSKTINSHLQQLYSRIKALEPRPPEVNPNIVVVEPPTESKSN